MKHYLLILTLLFSSGAVRQSFGQTMDDDKAALLALYNSTNGSTSWTHNFGWSTPDMVGSSPCGWYGVTCNMALDRVVGLNLSVNHLAGPLPAEIGNLTALISLNLEGNESDAFQGTGGINGAIPSQIGNLVNLEYLDLGGNRFTGTIPPSIGNLIKLMELDLHYLPFDEGFDPIGEIGGSIPPELGNLVNLVSLDLSRQNLTGNIPPELGKLKVLISLDLTNNDFSGTIPPALGKLKNLLFLGLEFGFKGFPPKEWGDLTGPIPDLSELPVAAKVYISKQSFTFAGMESNISRLGSYSPQNLIPLLITPAFPLPYIISVEAGGNESNNTYKFFKDGVLVATQVGDSRLFIMGGGSYKIQVTNSIVPGLTLYSEEMFIELGSMPVTLVSFTGKNKPEGTKLTWKTSGEKNNSGFEIERSADARSFEKVGFVDGNGTSNENNVYNFLDSNPQKVNYYRLKQIDLDGKFEYSRIISVNQDQAKLSLYPNPTTNQFFVKGLEKDETIVIRNSSGFTLSNQKISPAEPIVTNKLANGIYIIQIGEEVKKLVIQK